MSDDQTELMRILVETAQAHHAATGGTNPRWAEWYAERSVDEVNQVLASDMTVADFGSWLAAADRRYTTETPDLSWPRAYASWLLEEHGPSSRPSM
jgi:hypothetical protein